MGKHFDELGDFSVLSLLPVYVRQRIEKKVVWCLIHKGSYGNNSW